MHEITLDALPGDGDGLGNCMQTKLTADSNVSGDTNVSTIKTDAVLIKPTTIDTDAMSTKPVGGTLAMLTNVDTLKEEPGPSKEKKPGPSKEKDAPTHFVTRHKAFNGSMRGPRYAMLVHLAMMLSKVSGSGLPSDDTAHDLLLSSLLAANIPVPTSNDRRLTWDVSPSVREPVALGMAEHFALLTKTGITTTGATSVTALPLPLPLNLALTLTPARTLPLPLPLPLPPPLFTRTPHP